MKLQWGPHRHTDTTTPHPHTHTHTHTHTHRERQTLSTQERRGPITLSSSFTCHRSEFEENARLWAEISILFIYLLNFQKYCLGFVAHICDKTQSHRGYARIIGPCPHACLLWLPCIKVTSREVRPGRDLTRCARGRESGRERERRRRRRWHRTIRTSLSKYRKTEGMEGEVTIRGGGGREAGGRI